MIVFPAIDLLDGACVRLAQGDFSRKTDYSNDPLAVAESFKSEGAEWLHVVDLDGARTGTAKNRHLIGELASIGLKLQVGGGVRTMADVDALIQMGVKRIVSGSSLVSNEEFRIDFLKLSGIAVAGVDVKGHSVATQGWEKTENLDLFYWLKTLEENGCESYVLTDISKDGMQTGPNFPLLQEVLTRSSMKVVQSGGIGSINHIQGLLDLKNDRLDGVILGRALYENSLSLNEVFSAIIS